MASIICQVVALKSNGGDLPAHLAHKESLEIQKQLNVEPSNLRRPTVSGYRRLVGKTLALKAKTLHASKDSELAVAERPVHSVSAPKLLEVSTSAMCCVIMCCLLMIVYTALALCRTYHELSNTTKGTLEASLRAAAQTLAYGPMLCALFIACQMRVQGLSGGKAQPQGWVQKCMSGLCFAVLMNTLLVLTIHSISGKPIKLRENPFDVEESHDEIREGYKVTFYALTIVRYVFLFAVYAGIGAVLYGICTYLPVGHTNLNDVPAPEPAIMCTMILAVVFFSSQFVIAVCRTLSEHTRVHFPKIIGMMHALIVTVEFAPVLAVLFLAAHAGATQHDKELENWVYNCMIITTGSECLAVLLAIIVPLTMCGTLRKNPWTCKLVVEVPKPTLGYIFVGLRYAWLLVLYASAAGIVVAIYALESPGSQTTLPLSPTVQCAVNLVCQFLFVYFLVILMITASEMTGGTVPIEKWSLFPAIEAARSTLSFVPMICALFIATHMQMAFLAGKAAFPAQWIHDGMYLATWALQMTAGMCLASGAFAKTKIDFAGNVVNKFSNWYIGVTVVGLRYLSLLLLYGGLITVMIGLTTMSRESTLRK